MSKGKIIYIGGFELPDKNAAAHRVLNVGKIFESMGYETVYCGIHNGDKPEYHNKKYYSFERPKSWIDWYIYILNAKKYIKFLKDFSNVKMIVLYNFPSFLSYKILKYCKKKKIKCVADITEWYLSKTKSILFDLVKNIDSNLRMKYLNKRMDGLILVSSFLYSYYGDSKNNILLPPLVNSSDKMYKSIGQNANNNINFIYNGDPGKKDNISFILCILKQMITNKIHFDIVGITKEQFIEKNSNLDISCLNFDNVRFHGRVSHKESINMLKKSDALIFYRDDNIVSKAGFSTKYVEATTCGIPVVTNLTSDLSKYVKDGKNAIVLDSNVSNNVNKLEKITKRDIEKLKRNIDVSIFDYRHYIDKTNDWIKTILD